MRMIGPLRWRRVAPWGAQVVLAGAIVLIVGFRVFEIVSGHVTPTTGCRVTGVIDGDTVRLSCPGHDEDRGRLVGFDTPEVFSPQCAAELRKGLAAMAHLRQVIWEASEIEAEVRGADRYGRLLIVLRLDGVDAAEIMVVAGLARRYAGGTRRGWCE